MSVKIRLLRVGKKKQPYYRVVVADSRSPRDGRIIERLGRYSPLDEPSTVDVDSERALHWLRNGAQPSEAVQKILEASGIWDEFRAERPQADTVARRKIQSHKTALANRPPEPEPEPEPEAPAEASDEAGENADGGTGDDSGEDAAAEASDEASEKAGDDASEGATAESGDEADEGAGDDAGNDAGEGANDEEADSEEQSGE